jgi:cytochrome c5
MRNTAFFLAGVMVASAVVANASDPTAEERYRIKYGRYTPAEEARRAGRTQPRQHMAGDCCRSAHGAPVAMAATKNDPSSEEARFAAKYGRVPPQAEVRERRAEPELAAHHQKCIEIGQCSRTPPYAMAAVTPAPSDAGLRLKAKYGASESASSGAGAAKDEPQLAVFAGSCQHACCEHAE